MHAGPEVTVVVPTYNGTTRLDGLIAALARQTLDRSRYEIVIVDDASSDDLAGWARQHPEIRVLRSPRNIGQGGASNLGVKEARGSIIAMTDDDTFPAPDWLERGVKLMDDEGGAFLGGRISLELSSHPTACELLDYGMGYLDQEQNIAGGFAATANFWAPRDAFLQLGGFSEEVHAQCHDVEFGHRLRGAGYRLLYAAEVVVAHPARSGARAFVRKQFRLGLTAAELRRVGVAPFATQPPLWTQRGYYRPWLRVWGVERIRSKGIQLSRWRLVQLLAMQYLALQWPMVIGSARGSFMFRAPA